MTTAKISRRGLLHSSAAVAVTVAMSPCRPAQAQSPAGDWTARKQKRDIRGLKMAYYEVGAGDPIVFLHGNPTSSYLWRNIMPYVHHLGRCIAPDMLGMGDSDRLPDSGPGKYTFVTHRDYLFELFDALGVHDKVVFVLHDWGSAVGFSWAQRHPDRVKGIAYAEAILRRPDMPRPEPTTGPFTIFRSPAGDEAVLQHNMFVEQLLLGSLRYYLTEEDQAEYRRPYLEPGESRRPTLSWPRELPLGGQPKVNDDLIKSYSEWLANDTRIPKLFMRAVPGAIFANPQMLEFAQSFKNQKEIPVYGGHFVQEVSPAAMGRILAEWIPSLG
jgi:haloalkane dehalogenase